ncbi:MAG: efflux RND transporter permease subunit [Verrucomicrobiota bacterium]
MEGLIHWFAKNHVAANFLMILILLMGWKTWDSRKKEIFPETSVDAIWVAVPYPNAAPEEVEKGIILPIEEAIEDLNGIDRITSIAALGNGTVMIEVEDSYNVRDVMTDVKTRVDAIENFAEDAEEPVLEELLIKAQVLSIAVSADTDESTLREITERVRDELRLLPEITQVEIANVRPYEISIEVSETTLRELEFTLQQVADAVRDSSLDLPGGSIRTEGGEILLRADAKKYRTPDFEDITVVTRPDGSVVKLRDIATVIDGFEEVDIDSSFDGRNAAIINVFRTGNQDTLAVANAATNFVRYEAPKILPPGVTLDVWRDESVFLDGRMRLLAKNGIAGLLLVFIVLALFLRPSIAVLVSVGIPVSFAGAIATMPFTGISINMISLFAFILVLGIVVDDAIIIGENVYRRMRTGEDPKIAAPRGTHEVGVVVIFGILTTVVAFTPMLFLSGVSGKIWPNIPWIVIPTLLFSLVQSKLILPAHLAMLPRIDPKAPVSKFRQFQRRFSNGLEEFVDRHYRPFLARALQHRYVVLTMFVSLLIIVVSLVAFRHIKFQFFPEVEADILTAKVEMPNGVPFEVTREAIKQLENAAFTIRDDYQNNNGDPVWAHMLASSGSQPLQVGFGAVGGPPISSHLGEVTIELQPASTRSVTALELASEWRNRTGAIPGAVEVTFQAISATAGNAIDLEITGNNIEELEAASAMIREELSKFEGVIDIADNNRRGKREFKLNILPSGEALGLRLNDVARQVRQAFYGEEAQRLQRGRDEVKVMVRYPREEREAVANLHEMKIRTDQGDEVPFLEIADPTLDRSYSSIKRSDRRRAITITADIDKSTGVNANEVVAAITAGLTPESDFAITIRNFANWLRGLAGKEPVQPEKGALVKAKEKFPGINYIFQGEQKDQRQSVAEIGSGMLVALIIMYVLMAIPLRSYIQPVIVMSVIPFGIVGAVLGHVIMRTELSIMSMCGIVALAGVVVNDSLVLVDYVNRHRNDGKGIIHAIREAGARRFRPILLTSLTTFAGLTPMLLETDMQAKFLIPMAISLSFGILFATTITLILIPCVYLMLEDVKQFLRRTFSHKSEELASESPELV